MSTDTVICRSGDTQFYAPSLTLPRIAADSASTLDAEGSVAKREKEHVMVAEGMIRRGASIRKVAEQLGVTVRISAQTDQPFRSKLTTRFGSS